LCRGVCEGWGDGRGDVAGGQGVGVAALWGQGGAANCLRITGGVNGTSISTWGGEEGRSWGDHARGVKIPRRQIGWGRGGGGPMRVGPGCGGGVGGNGTCENTRRSIGARYFRPGRRLGLLRGGLGRKKIPMSRRGGVRGVRGGPANRVGGGGGGRGGVLCGLGPKVSLWGFGTGGAAGQDDYPRRIGKLAKNARKLIHANHPGITMSGRGGGFGLPTHPPAG